MLGKAGTSVYSIDKQKINDHLFLTESSSLYFLFFLCVEKHMPYVEKVSFKNIVYQSKG